MGRPDSDYWEVNVTALQRLLKSAAKAGVRRFVSCSTADLAGNVLTPPSDEESACATDDIYQITKAHGEYAALFADGKDGMEVTVVRPTVVYGPGDRRRLKDIYRRPQAGRFRLIGSGDKPYPPGLCRRPCRGDDSCLCARRKSPGNVYIIGGARDRYRSGSGSQSSGKPLAWKCCSLTRPALPMRLAAVISGKTLFPF